MELQRERKGRKNSRFLIVASVVGVISAEKRVSEKSPPTFMGRGIAPLRGSGVSSQSPCIHHAGPMITGRSGLVFRFLPRITWLRIILRCSASVVVVPVGPGVMMKGRDGVDIVAAARVRNEDEVGMFPAIRKALWKKTYQNGPFIVDQCRYGHLPDDDGTAVCLLTLVSAAVVHGLAVCPDRRTKQPSLRSFKIDIKSLLPRIEAHI